MLWILFFIITGSLAFGFIRNLSSEDERLKVFLRAYRKTKIEHPDFPERKLLEMVVEWHIPYRSSRTWKGDGLTGQQYMDGVYENMDGESKNQEIVLKELIVDLMGLEYPKKYGWQSETTDEQMAAWNAGKKTPKQIRIESLKARIEKFAGDLEVTLKDKTT